VITINTGHKWTGLSWNATNYLVSTSGNTANFFNFFNFFMYFY